MISGIICGQMACEKSEIQLACELIRVLNGLPIKQARDALARADMLLLTTQVVRADSPLLVEADQTDITLGH